MQRDGYREAIEAAGFEIEAWRENPRVPLRVRPRRQRDSEVRRDEHLAARQEELKEGRG